MEGHGASSEPRYGPEYFRDVYRDYAAQNPPRKLAFYRGLADRAAGDRARPRLLEVGCGPGFFLAGLDPRFERFGTDVSAWAVTQARSRVPAAAIEQASAEAVPFSGEFDVAAAFDVLEHLPDPAAALAALDARVKPGGAIVFVVPVYDGPAGILVRALDRDPTHVQKHSRRFWLSLAAGRFRVEEWWGIFRYLLPRGPYVHVPSLRLRGLAPAIAVLARKPA